MEHYKKQGFPAYIAWRNAALKTGFTLVVSHYFFLQNARHVPTHTKTSTHVTRNAARRTGIVW